MVTIDEYKLTMHRIWNPHALPTENKPVVFLQHGLKMSSEAFVMNSDDSIAFGLANLGYDVWLGNNRGGLYGKEHLKLDPHRRTPDQAGKFFDYSFYEMGKFDLPSMIDYVLIEAS